MPTTEQDNRQAEVVHMARESGGRKVLVLAFHFPPDSAVGARRTERFVRYLPTCGWTPHVLTVRKTYYERTDPNGRHPQGDACEVTRTRMLWNLNDLYLALKRLARSGRVGASQVARPNPGPRKATSAWRRVSNSLLLLPDNRQGWLPVAVIAGMRILGKGDTDCIYSSGPPWTTHLVGLVLSRFSGVPWVADFRDPWFPADWKPENSTSWLSERLETALRKRVLDHASAVICNSGLAARELVGAQPDLARKVSTIPNGFDPVEVQLAARTVVRPANSLPKVLIHAGTLYKHRDPKVLLCQIDSLISEGLLDARSLRLEFIGMNELSSPETRWMMDRLAGLGCLSETEQIPRAECMSRQAAADGMLLLAIRQPAQVPGKLYEYMLMRKPILAITEGNSATAEIVERTKTGVVADYRDPASLRAGLFRMMETLSGVGDAFSPDDYEIGKFDASRLTEDLASVLASVSGDGRRMKGR